LLILDGRWVDDLDFKFAGLIDLLVLAIDKFLLSANEGGELREYLMFD